MRSLSGHPEPLFLALYPLGLILAALAPPIWGVGGLIFGLAFLVYGVLLLALSACLGLVLAPLVLACRFWPGWRWGWLCLPHWFLEPWPWLCRCWLLWPWLCWSWLR